MDLKVYYKRLKQIEAELPEPYVVVISQGTPDGGRAGVATETSRAIASRLILEGTARVATEEEAAQFCQKVAEAKRKADQLAEASTLKLRVITETETRKPTGAGKGAKPQEL